MRRLFLCMVVATVVVGMAVPAAWSADKPDFGDSDAVLGNIRAMLDECSESGCKDCMVKCGYALKTLKNFLKANPEGDPSILKQRWQPCFEAHRDADLKTPGKPAAQGVPDFRDHEAVVASLKALRAKCGNNAACIKECDYQLKSIHNFRHPQPHFVALRKGKWEKCRDKVPEMAAKVAEAKAKAAPTYDRNKFVIAGLQFGGAMNPHRKRCQLLEAYGYHKKTKLEHYDWIQNRGKTQPGPEVIRNYKGLIREAPVYIHFEATADGRIYMIQFEQKEDLEIDQIKAALIKRYGKPNKHHGNYLYWGCKGGPQEGFCVKAHLSATNMTIWAFDEDLKKAAFKDYGKRVLKAKGIKAGPKF